MRSNSLASRKVCFIVGILSLTFIIVVLLRNSHRIAKLNLPLALLAPASTRNFSDIAAEPEELFAGFNNETGVNEHIIPDYAHFVLFDQAGKLDFTSFLCILAAIKVHRPSVVYLHSDSPLYAGSNNHNRYWLALTDASKSLNVSLRTRHLPRPSHVFGQRISSVWHASDVSRIGLLWQYGGVVLDRDQLILKPLHDYRRFELVLGWPEGQFIGTQLLMAHPRARLLHPWLEGYRQYRPSMWYYNAAQLPTQTLLSERPELVHRERWRFGVHNLAHEIYGSTPWPDWHQFSAIHLLSRHKYLLSSKDQALLPKGSDQIDEFSVQTYETPFGEMARYILHEVPPKLASPALWPGTH
ncbi:hypothetical protein B566_EDAN011332 [Ephemera danica]|nr:hypothetical protein B566_EDAN011332 [Ephemera danica]